MKIIISGHTGFIGSNLTRFFKAAGHEVKGISRRDLYQGVDHLTSLIEGNEIVINLAGAPIIHKWTKSYCRELWDSRILTTRNISDAIAGCTVKPRAFLSASAVGYYAEEGINTEDNLTQNPDFLGILCQRWEEEALRARISCRIYIMRVGIALGKDGGALPQMAAPFKMFMGGKLGSGKQMVSWIHILDLCRAVELIIEKRPDKQVFNLTAPNPVSNDHFTTVLAKKLNKPRFFSVPAAALKILYGEGAVALLRGQTVLPHNLQMEGFIHKFPRLEEALENLL